MESNNIIERTLKNLQERKEKIENGGINSVPSPFKRFSDDFLGIEQKKYYIVTGNQKSGKTQFASFMFVYTPLLYAYRNPDKMRIKIFYYSLEESPEDVLQRFMSFLLNRINGIRISPTDLMSSNNERPVSQEVLDALKEGEISELLEFFKDHVEFSPSRNPTGVLNEIKKYCKENGTVHTKKMQINDELGRLKDVDVFDYYEPNDKDEYVIVFFDHISLVQPEKGMRDVKEAADKLSENMIILRNRYGITPVVVQQQMSAMESLDAFKEKKLRPTAQGLADTKYTSRDKGVYILYIQYIYNSHVTP